MSQIQASDYKCLIITSYQLRITSCYLKIIAKRKS